MLERIESLLKSSNLDDIFIAIDLAYTLPVEEFHTLFNRKVPTKVLPNDKHYYFIREGIIYFQGNAYLGRSERDYTLAEFLSRYRLGSYINLTPDEYER